MGSSSSTTGTKSHGIPAMLVAPGIAAGARSPTQIPLRDAILYVGISVAIVAGILVYTLYRY